MGLTRKRKDIIVIIHRRCHEICADKQMSNSRATTIAIQEKDRMQDATTSHVDDDDHRAHEKVTIM